MNWINIKEKLPENEKIYLVYGYLFKDAIKIGPATAMAYWNDSYKHFMHDVNAFLEVSHWMPLPTPPILESD